MASFMGALIRVNELVGTKTGEHTPGAEAPFFRFEERAKAEALAYLEAGRP